MQISRKQLRYIYNRFTFTRPSFAYYPVNSATPGKRATYGEARVGLMTDGRAGVLIEEGTTNLVPAFSAWGVNGCVVGGERITASLANAFLRATFASSVAAYAYQAEVKQGNTGITEIGLYDASASNLVAKLRITWSTRAVTLSYGTGQIFTEERADGWLWVALKAEFPEAGSDYAYFYPAGQGIAVEGSYVFARSPQVERKSYPTSWTDGTRSPETISAPVPFTPAQGGEISFRVDVNDACKRQVAGQYPRLIEMTRAIGGAGMYVAHSESVAQFTMRTLNDAGEYTQTVFSDSLIPNGARTLDVIHDKAIPAVILECDGTEIARITNPALPSGWGGAYPGSDATGKNHADAMFGGIKMTAADSTVLSDVLFNGPDFVRKARTIQL